METTRVSLIHRLQAADNAEAWHEFAGIYRPILLRYARACGLRADDAEDIAQECLTLIDQHIGRFEYDKRRGGLKRWLRVVVKRRVINRLRKRQERIAETAAFRRPQDRERPPEEAFEQIWLQEHLQYCLAELENHVEARTCEIYRRLVLDEWAVERVCQAYDVTRTNAYVIKSRLTTRLREMMTKLVGDVV